MKKIINGRKYDTDTAQEIGHWSNSLSYTDFGYCEETLYRKKTGEFFLCGEGGAMSRYATSYNDGMTGGGKRIIPIDQEEAEEWIERHCSTETYEEVFGTVEE